MVGQPRSQEPHEIVGNDRLAADKLPPEINHLASQPDMLLLVIRSGRIVVARHQALLSGDVGFRIVDQRVEHVAHDLLAPPEGERLFVLHTQVPRSLAGHGIGSALAQAALDYARAEGLLVVPHCPFMHHYLVQHPVDLALVDPAFRPPNHQG
jgi:predicted GNAT family acetyltransferase